MFHTSCTSSSPERSSDSCVLFILMVVTGLTAQLTFTLVSSDETVWTNNSNIRPAAVWAEPSRTQRVVTAPTWSSQCEESAQSLKISSLVCLCGSFPDVLFFISIKVYFAYRCLTGRRPTWTWWEEGWASSASSSAARQETRSRSLPVERETTSAFQNKSRTVWREEQYFSGFLFVAWQHERNVFFTCDVKHTLKVWPQL